MVIAGCGDSTSWLAGMNPLRLFHSTSNPLGCSNDSQLNRGVRVGHLLDLFPISLSSTWHARLVCWCWLPSFPVRVLLLRPVAFGCVFPSCKRALPNILHRVEVGGRVVEPLYPCSCIAFLDPNFAYNKPGSIFPESLIQMLPESP